MKIMITTIREFPDHLFDEYLYSQKILLPWLNIKKFKKHKEQEFSSVEQIPFDKRYYSKATTKIEIIEGH